MDTLRSRGVVRRIIEKDGTLLVSFFSHDGYFRLADADKIPELKSQILKAQLHHKEITFTFDKNLNILEMDGANAG